MTTKLRKDFATKNLATKDLNSHLYDGKTEKIRDFPVQNGTSGQLTAAPHVLCRKNAPWNFKFCGSFQILLLLLETDRYA